MDLLVVILFLLTSILLPAVQGESYSKNQGTIPFHVGVILDEGSPVGKTGSTSISLAAEDFYSEHDDYTTRLVFHAKDSGNTTIGAAAAALDLLGSAHVQAIIGPQTSTQVAFVANLGNAVQVPIISFSATSPSALGSSNISYFVRTASNDASQVDAISSIVEAFGWRRVVLVHDDTTFGKGIGPYLVESLQAVNVVVPYRSVLPLRATDDHVSKELYKLMTMQTRVFVIHTSPELGSRVFLKASEIGMMSKGYVWIMTDGLTSVLMTGGSMDEPSALDSMQGALGVRPYIPLSDDLVRFSRRWLRRFRLENPDDMARAELNVYGIWAYDTVRALAMAVENVAREIPDKHPRNGSQESWGTDGTISLEQLKVSSVGPELLTALLRTQFDGVGGEFRITSPVGQSQTSTFQVINVNGRGAGSREIGFWTRTCGLTRQLTRAPKRCNKASASPCGSAGGVPLAPVIWPGESTSVPRGWEVPTCKKTLKIGIPVKTGFYEFVNVKHDNCTNRSIVTGFCIDVFEAVVQEMPYAISYEFVPFQNASGHMNGSYTEMVRQVEKQIYDAVIGDVTITAERSEWVDFTVPFIESGVAMLVPVKSNPNKEPNFFLAPLSPDLGIAIVALFLYTGFIIWMIEYEKNEEFRSRAPGEHFHVVVYFSLSTFTFSHRENLKNDLSRLALIVWLLVVLVLTSSYIASLTSMLTVDNPQPEFTDIYQLKNNGKHVGYSKDSFVKDLLLKMYDFRESSIKSLTTLESYVEALNNGTSKRGVAAVLQEIPYIKIFLSRSWREGYIMTDPIVKTAGLGFVFPKGSSLVPDFSQAILKVKEGGRMLEIEKKWFRNACQEEESIITSGNLTLRSFSVLYIIAGVVYMAAILASFHVKMWKKRMNI